MAAADTDVVKRPRLDSWSGSSQRVETSSNPPSQSYTHFQYAAPHAPQAPPSPSAYQEPISAADPRGSELPSPSPHPFHHPHSGYVTPNNGLSGPTQPADPVSLPPGQIPVKARPLNDQQQLHQLRPLSIATGSGQTGLHHPQPHLDHSGPGNTGAPVQDQHLPSGTDGNMSGVHQGLPYPQQHDGQPVGHGGVYAPSPNVSTPISAGPGHPLLMSGLGGGGPFITTTYPPRRKAIRAAQACDACRQRKAKCDEGRPSCGFCKEAVLACVYREVPPPKQDRTLLQILDRLARIETKLDNKEDGPRTSASAAPPTSLPQGLQDLNAAPPPRPVAPLRRASASNMHERLQSASFSSDIATDEQDKDSEGPGELSIPMEHTTAAHKLLRWPSIKAFISKITDNEDYVMEAEENRGLLRLYGRGEGIDRGDGSGLGEGSDAGSPDADDGNPGSSTSPTELLWGTGLTTGDNVEVRRRDAHRAGGLNADGTLQLDPPRVSHLLNSYFQNIHILHPFLDKERVISMVSALQAKISSANNNATGVPPSSPFAVSSMQNPPAKPPKRKRSTTGLVGPNSVPSHSTSRTPLERSISTAIVLLVLALGKICDHRTWVPGPALDNKKSSPRSMMSPPLKTDSPPTSVKHSPTSSASSTYSTLPSPYEGPRMPSLSRRTSIEGHAVFEKKPFESRNVEPRNVDVIPGLAYYTLATEILGSLNGGNDLPHVQAGLLAGLYCGQIGRVLESWRWINSACIGCQVLLRKNKLRNEQNAARKDLVICAFWTCLQLESDVLAELDLPPSGISRLEPIMPLPTCTGTGVTDPAGNDPESLMWMYYLAQITLRKLLNRVHSELYKENKDSKHAGWSTESAAELDWQLGRWRNVLPPQLRWDDDEPPPADINAARLRAKYYGARYIIHRPFVHHALHPLVPHGTYPGLPEESSQLAGRLSNQSSPTNLAALPVNPAFEPNGRRKSGMAMAPPEPVASVVDKSVIDACKNCICAAIQSTKAFHGVRGRPIVTNIFGTAHAQFGNLLVLQAAYRSQLLRPIVRPDDLRYLMEETIQFFRHLAPISPTLETDAQILESSMKTLDFNQNVSAPSAALFNAFGERSSGAPSPYVTAPLSNSR
ncbi:MAG: hypothetical protein M1839_000017 [Geoglossum umbratile]|nr:MAG: hypothetical protein M1839_000017 [Geoglossum umbratile]